ncbi:MAG TPA: FtsQ-type POTRA domain-containing protein [Kofleriaceae bacterium]|nr:FtsQ-type POTRA domain-containing protein [Kofleriaceae bacterium]
MPKPAAIADACGRALRRAVPAAAILAAAVAATGGLWAGYRWVTGSPRFAINAIEIHGAHHVDPEAVRAALPIHVGDNVFVGLTATSRAAFVSPWLASVEVHRILPHTIALELHEHQAAAVVELGELYLVDPSGHPFKRAALETGEADGLPIITGLDRAAFAADPDAVATTVREAVAAFEGWKLAGRPAIGEVHLDAHGAVTLHTYDPAIAIQLGALGPELATRMHTFDTAWAGLSEDERARARAIHLDARPDHVIVAFAKD